jgi:hypothetical protein
MKTATTSLYSNTNGMICCVDHGGSYLMSAYSRKPEARTYRTPNDAWEILDADYIAMWREEVGGDPRCEFCA